MLGRRSARLLAPPGPTADELDAILRAASTVPDHGRLRPYRFVVVEGDARARFGDALAAATEELEGPLSAEARERCRAKAFVGPTLVVIVASPLPGSRIAEWEQVATAACTGYAISLAAHALGLGAVWKSAAFLEGTALRGLFALEPHERLLGWVNLGQLVAAQPSATPVDLTRAVSVLHAEGPTDHHVSARS
jgi:nitroreductase